MQDALFYEFLRFEKSEMVNHVLFLETFYADYIKIKYTKQKKSL